jgi:hypothetical protein
LDADREENGVKKLTLEDLEKSRDLTIALLLILEPLGAAGDLTPEGSLQLDEPIDATDVLEDAILEGKELELAEEARARIVAALTFQRQQRLRLILEAHLERLNEQIERIRGGRE